MAWGFRLAGGQDEGISLKLSKVEQHHINININGNIFPGCAAVSFRSGGPVTEGLVGCGPRANCARPKP